MHIIDRSEKTIFYSRWILAPLYVLLNVGLILYTYKFAQELYEMFIHIGSLSTEMAMLGLLGLVDITMVANLVIMVLVGGYSIFVKEIKVSDFNNRPRFMTNITSSGLKIKMGTSLIGVSSIHLLKVFIEAASHDNKIDWSHLGMLLIIHIVFVLSTVALAVIDKLTHSKETDHAATPIVAH